MYIGEQELKSMTAMKSCDVILKARTSDSWAADHLSCGFFCRHLVRKSWKFLDHILSPSVGGSAFCIFIRTCIR